MNQELQPVSLFNFNFYFYLLLGAEKISRQGYLVFPLPLYCTKITHNRNTRNIWSYSSSLDLNDARNKFIDKESIFAGAKDLQTLPVFFFLVGRSTSYQQLVSD
ncbi:hypothetical protein EYC80_003899 [Monilinia laxa]|uniref:Uncharacterized protein n=1 Tax=Monilinia laxa TaxID=61186 RepID=A0A5N6KLE5_MONLA|nr:hypothetical protein EYC80_003899 [Monilinia laxa]